MCALAAARGQWGAPRCGRGGPGWAGPAGGEAWSELWSLSVRKQFPRGRMAGCRGKVEVVV